MGNVSASKVGDQLVLIRDQHKAELVTVMRVGSKYLYVSAPPNPNREHRYGFTREGGIEVGHKFGIPERVITVGDHAAALYVRALREALATKGWSHRSPSVRTRTPGYTEFEKVAIALSIDVLALRHPIETEWDVIL